MNILELTNYEVKIRPEALSLTVFKDLWDRDRTKDKRTARAEISYIYFMVDVRSDYLSFTNEEERSKEICRDQGMPPSWSPDKKVQKAMEFYKSKLPEEAQWLDDERKFIDKIRNAMLNINPSDTDENGRLVNPLNQTTGLVKTMNEAMMSYNNTKKAIFSDIQSAERIRGSQEKSQFEDLNFTNI